MDPYLGIFMACWFIMGIFVVSMLISKGKKALSIFPDEESEIILFKGSKFSGFSGQSRLIRFDGAANGSLTIIVTKEELWLKTDLIFAAPLEKFDLIHRIKRVNIKSVDLQKRNKVQVTFYTDQGQLKVITLKSKKVNELISVLNK